MHLLCVVLVLKVFLVIFTIKNDYLSSL